ncbi:DALR anticodon-binding domain-containing protein 3 [Anticarsia gemmatalis]|uniref:DALR anticodon-binding domain-containing protein 3 n=1 Tax=Anticarsia gemmatalis TaxID=129554 RepID=UPI003F768624
MVENALECFAKKIILHLTGELKVNKKDLLIKKHDDNLATHGDFSFPCSAQSWQEYDVCNNVVDKKNTTLFQPISKQPEDIIKESEKWDLPVGKLTQDKGRIHLYLERPKAIRVGLTEALRNVSILLQRIRRPYPKVELDPLCTEGCDITSLRAKYVCDAIRNICAYHELDVSVFVTCKSSSVKLDAHSSFCGTVLNAKTGHKETDITANDFIKLRQNEMTLIAQHKYGVRETKDPKWKDFIAHLGESAVVFELLQTNSRSPIKINFDSCAGGSTKGASFILYNCARLETIIKTYYDKVCEGTYPELPKLEETDLTLLTQEEEWSLIFTYIMGLPTVLNLCATVEVEHCEFRPYQICHYLSKMVKLFSQYYRRVRILTEPRKHLLPVMFARIHMLIILNDTLKACLKILNIKSVSQM